jgi:hypothetical protein
MAGVRDIAFRLVFETGDAQKALETFKAAITNVGKEGGKAIDEMAKAQLNYAKGLEKLKQEEEKTAQARAKTFKDNETALNSALKSESDLRSRMLKEANDQEKAAFEQRKRLMAEDLAAKKQAEAEKQKAQKDSNQASLNNIKAATAEEAKAVLAAQVKINAARASGANDKTMRAAEKQLADAKLAYIEATIKATQKEYTDRIAAAKNGTAEIQKIEREAADNLAKLEAQRGTAQKGAAKAGKKPEGMGPLNRATFELAENASTVSKSLQSGDVASLGAMFGPIGATVGVVADQFFNLAKGAFELGEAAIHVEEKFHGFAAVLQLVNNDISQVQLNQIRVELEAIQRPLGITQEGLFDLAKAVAGFEKPDAIAQTTEAVLQLSRIQPGQNVAQLAQDIQGLTDGTKGYTEAADIAAIASNQLRGDSLAPLTDSIRSISAVLVDARVGMEDQSEAAKQAAVIYTTLVKSGMDPAGEAASHAQKLFRGLNDAMNDPATMKALTKALPEGFDLVANGLERGNLDVVKFASAMEKLGPTADQVGAALGPKLGGQALLAMTSGFERGISSIGDAVLAFENVGGAAARSAALLTPMSVKLEEVRAQRFDDFATNLGQSFMHGVEASKGALNDLLGWFATADLGPFDAIRDLFVDSNVEAERAVKQFEAVHDSVAAFGSEVDALSALSGDDFMSQLNQSMEMLSAQAPGTAAEIQHIVDTMGEPGTAEYAAQMDKIKGLLQESKDIKASEEFFAMADAMDAINEKIKDVASGSEGMFDSWSGFFAGAADLIGMPEEVGNAVRKSYAEVTADAQSSLEELRADAAEAKAALAEDPSDKGAREDLAEANAEIGKQLLAVSEARNAQATATNDALTAAQQLAQTTSNIADADERRQAILSGLQPLLASQPEIAGQLIGNLDSIIAGEEHIVDAQGKIVKGKTEVLDATDQQVSATDTLIAQSQELNSLANTQVEAARALGVEDASAEANKEKAVAANIATNEQLIAQMETKLKFIDLEIAGVQLTKEQLAQQAEIEENINKIKEDRNKIAAGASATVSAMDASSGPTTSLEGQRAELVASIEQLKNVNNDSAKFLADADQKRADTAQKAGEKQAKEIEKIAKDREAAEKKIKDAAEKAAADRDKAGQDAFNEREKQNDRFKAISAEDDKRLKAISDMNSAIRRFAEGMKTEVTNFNFSQIGQLGSGLQSLLTPIQRAQMEFDNLVGSQQDAIKAMQARTRSEIAARDAFVGGQGGDAVRARDLASGEVQRLKRELGQTSTRAAGQGTIDAIKAKLEAAEATLLQAETALLSARANYAQQSAQIESAFSATRDVETSPFALLAQETFKLQELYTQQQKVARVESELALEADLKKRQELQDQLEIERGIESTIATKNKLDGDGLQQAIQRVSSLRESVDVGELAEKGTRDQIQAYNLVGDLVDKINAGIVASAEDLAKYRSELEATKSKEVEVEAELTRLKAEQAALAERNLAGGMGLMEFRDQDKVLEDQIKAAEAGLTTLKDTAKQLELNITQAGNAVTQMATQGELASVNGDLEDINNTLLEQQNITNKTAQNYKTIQTQLTKRLAIEQLMGMEATRRLLQARQDRKNLSITEEQLKDAETAYENIHAQITATGQALTENSKSIGDAESQAADKIREKFDNFKQGIDMVQGVIDAMPSLLGEGDAGDKVTAVADLTQKVGEALLNSKDPNVALVGAVIVGASLITKALVGLARLFEQPELTAVEQAEQRERVETRLLAVMDARRKMTESLIALGALELDQAHEQLEAEQSRLNILLKQSDAAKRMQKSGAQGIADLETEKAGIERMVAEAELAKEGAYGRRISFIRDNDLEGDGSSFEVIDAYLQEQQARLVDINTDLEAGNTLLEIKKNILELQKQILEEQVGLTQLQIKLGKDEQKGLEDIEKIRRRQVDAALMDIYKLTGPNSPFAKITMEVGGMVKSFSDLSEEQIKEILLQYSELAGNEISPTIQGIIDGWLQASDAVDSYSDKVDDLYDRQLKALELQRDLGKITEAEWKDSTLKLMTERLHLLEDQGLELLAQEHTEGQVLDNAIARMEIEMDIKNLLAGQNGEMNKGDKLLTKLIHQRQEMLAGFRQAGSMTPSQRAQLQAQTDAAVARMRELGASDDEIDRFLAALPQFEKGGYHATGGPAMMHPGEFTLPAPIVQAIGRDELERMLSASSFGASPVGRVLTARSMAMDRGGAQSIVIQFNGDFVFNVGSDQVANGSFTAAGAKAMESQLLRRIQTALASGELQPNRN